MRLAFVCVVAALVGSTSPQNAPPRSWVPSLAAETLVELTPTEGSVFRESDADEQSSCEDQIQAVLRLPGLTGATNLERNRLQVLSESKAEPVWFATTPTYEAQPSSPTVQRYRAQLTATQYPVDVLARLVPVFAAAPKVGRDVLLKQGYLFADEPDLARALVTSVKVEHLFAHDSIWLRRGELTMHAVRRNGIYYYTDGPNAGDRVTLLLFDQLGYGVPPTTSLVRDFRSLRERLHFTEGHVTHATDDRMIVDLVYGENVVTTLLRNEGPRLELVCELKGANAASVVQFQQVASNRARLIQQLRGTMLEEVAEKLPFDEPRREWGHQFDGKLRQNWRHSYLMGRESFAFNGDRYFVFNSERKPLVPQVCIDFLTDTLERASGTWWRDGTTSRGRNVGKLDFEDLASIPREELRRVPTFVDFAKSRPDLFDVLDVPAKERVQMGNHDAFVSYLAANRADYQPGDIVVIRGPTPWDRRQMHYHSFFIYETDPMSGSPIAVVGNAGRPTVRYWRVETFRTPERAIWYRIRLNTPWLESIIDFEHPAAPSPVPLSPRGNTG
jgi:hypothetical protein